MNRKKKLPIVILKSLEPFVNLTEQKFIIIESKENLLYVTDIDKTSDFHFKIEKYEKKQNDSFKFLMSRKPIDENDNSICRAWIDIKDLKSQFEKWLNLLDQYESLNSFFDDPIVKSNAERFFKKFDIIDENAHFETFDLEQQLLLEEYLINCRKKLEKLKENETKEKKIQEIETLRTETDEIRAALTVESKKKIMIRLSKFWGRAQKTGLQIIKEVLIDFTTELTKKLLLGP